MDISQVRRKFQHLWDFTMLTSHNVNLSTAYYSLQQESLNSDDMLLYVTSDVVPSLEGSLLELEGQRWIVYLAMKELSNKKMYEYRLFPVTDTITIREVNTASNALGMVKVDDTGELITLDVFVEEYSLKERIVPTAQAVESYQQSFLVAANQLPNYRGTYILTYRGLNFKIDSFERSVGIIKIRCTEDL